MNIVFASDRGYLPHLSVAIASLLDTNADHILNIYIINTDISVEEWQELTKLDIKNRHFFINAKINENELSDLVINHHFTKANYYRLFIDKIVPGAKALYIDSDTVINGSLTELWNTDINGVFLAAVEEPHFTRHEELEMLPSSNYFNSGVMLLNLTKWRDECVRSNVLKFVRRKPYAIQFVDQCGLNAVINGNWSKINPKYNLQTAILEMDCKLIKKRYESFNIQDAINNPVIIHYTGTSKPWHLLNNHPYKRKYWHYLRRTSYKIFFPSDITLKRCLIWCLPEKLRHSILKILGKHT